MKKGRVTDYLRISCFEDMAKKISGTSLEYSI